VTRTARSIARGACLLALAAACAGLLAAWRSPDIVGAWAALASLCG
jgi:hypothetical protein